MPTKVKPAILPVSRFPFGRPFIAALPTAVHAGRGSRHCFQLSSECPTPAPPAPLNTEWNWKVDIILQWTLGWGLRKDVLLPPPDFLAGIVTCVWVVWLWRNQRRVRAAAQDGDVDAASKVLLQAFVPLVWRYAPLCVTQYFLVTCSALCGRRVPLRVPRIASRSMFWIPEPPPTPPLCLPVSCPCGVCVASCAQCCHRPGAWRRAVCLAVIAGGSRVVLPPPRPRRRLLPPHALH